MIKKNQNSNHKMAKNILEALINVSEKAANIARAFRKHEHLFELLVQEKSIEEANTRFVRDYKTLADVLIQQTIRYDIGKEVRKYTLTLVHICIYLLESLKITECAT